MSVTRRFVDVIFIEPKNRFYVILHKGQFWRLPRMQLTHNSWSLKKPYLGSYDDIFVAKDQHISDSVLAKILHTHHFPPQLGNLSATRFLQWWASKDYLWVNQDKAPTTASDTTSKASVPQGNTSASPISPDASVTPIAASAHFNATTDSNTREVADGLISDFSSGGYAPEIDIFSQMLNDLNKALAQPI